MQNIQSAWAMVGCLNAIAVAILLLALSGAAFTFWRIVGGILAMVVIFGLLYWKMVRQSSSQ